MTEFLGFLAGLAALSLISGAVLMAATYIGLGGWWKA